MRKLDVAEAAFYVLVAAYSVSVLVVLMFYVQPLRVLPALEERTREVGAAGSDVVEPAGGSVDAASGHYFDVEGCEEGAR